MSKENMSGQSLNAEATQRATNKKVDCDYSIPKEKRETYKEWTFKVVSENEEFRTDRGNPKLMKFFIDTSFHNVIVQDLPLYIFRATNSVVRTKNKILKDNPILDLRENYKSKIKEDNTPNLFDLAM